MKRTAHSRLFTVVVTLLIAATAPSMAQVPSDPNMVYLHVGVADRDGRPVTQLFREHFQIFEDNAPQKIDFFSDRDIPLNVALLFDADGSTKDQVKEMAITGLTRGRSPRDEFLLAEYPEVPLNEVVYRALNKLLQRGNDSKRVLVLFTMRADPGANSFSKVKEILRDQDVGFYVIGLPARPDLAGDQARPLLRELAEISGGNAFFPSSIYQVQNIYRTLGVELRNQYVIGYRSTNGADDGGWRKIKVNVEYVDKKKVHKLNARARRGYYAPTLAQSWPARQ